MTAKAITKSTRRLLACKNTLIHSSRSQSVWTSDKTIKSPFKNVDIPNRTIPEQIWENLGRWPDKPALVCGVTNHSYTYHQLYKYSRNFATKLCNKLGIRDHDVVCVMMPNSPDYALAVLGILQAGAEVTTVNPIYTAHEVQRQLLLSKPKIIISVPETISILKDALKLAKLDIPIIAVKTANESRPQGTISFEEFALDSTVDHSVLNKVSSKSNDIAFLPYSSGTTGLPKGVELTNRNLVSNFMQLDNEEVKHHCDTTLLFTGSHKDVSRDHLAHLKVVTSGAAPLPLNDVLRVIEKASPGMNFLQLYGLTETSPLVTAMVPGSENYSSSGFAVSNTELQIVNSEQHSLGPNEVGELLIRGPQVMKGYRDNPESTKAAVTEDGWFKSGDLARIDEDGAITIVDRLKELIKVKGYQVPPAELENVLKEHPSILDAAVIGISDAKQGEAPKAFIVVKEGHKLKPDDVMKFVEERVAVYKRLKEVMFMDVIPKNPSGKILRRVLREQYS
ncbi:AMP dependent coa ligase [Operophtera brumata]|uniref:AMP dependent coa ligase n=1 Tax=Operophtera brumata TaxID=104452 RepID=A0A0L7LSC9_OPEBR|nr:AMP dependent coa ligase [Operophtera brumata]